MTDPRALRRACAGCAPWSTSRPRTGTSPHATIEELDGLATWRLLRAAEHAGVGHFVFFSALGATRTTRSRLHRAKALAEQAVGEAALRTTTFAPSLVYAPGDRRLARLERLAWLPAVPLAGRGRARRSRSGPTTSPTACWRRWSRPAAGRTPATSWPGRTC